MVKIKKLQWSCMVIMTLFYMSFPILAEGHSSTVQDSLNTLFKFFLHGTKNKELDKPEIGYSGRGTWLENIIGLISKFNKNNMDLEPIYNELCEFLIDDSYPGNRKLAAQGLELTGKKEAFECLAAALEDTSLFVRIEAARAIISLGDSNNVKALEILANTASSEKIESMSEKEFIAAGENPFIFMMNKGKSADVRYKMSMKTRKRAIEGLHRSNSDYSKKVIKSLEKNKDKNIKDWAAGIGIQK